MHARSAALQNHLRATDCTESKQHLIWFVIACVRARCSGRARLHLAHAPPSGENKEAPERGNARERLENRVCEEVSAEKIHLLRAIKELELRYRRPTFCVQQPYQRAQN